MGAAQLTPSKSPRLPSPPSVYPGIWQMIGPSGLGREEGGQLTQSLHSAHSGRRHHRVQVSGVGGTQALGEGGGPGGAEGRSGGTGLGGEVGLFWAHCTEKPQRSWY